MKSCEFYEELSTCSSILDTISVEAEYADKMMSHLSVLREDDNGNIVSMSAYTDDHLASLQRTAKQLSSYADRFSSKLSLLVKNINSFLGESK